MRTAAASRVASLALLLALVPCAAAEDGDPGDDLFLEGDKQTCEDPPFRIERPNDSWRFIDVRKLEAQASARREDVSVYERLRYRLWYGSARANIYVTAWKDDQSREEPLTAEGFASTQIEGLRPVLGEMVVVRTAATKVGKRAGALFEVRGTLRGKPHAIVQAIVVRPEDHAIVLLSLECAPDDVKDLMKDFKTFLKKARI